MTKALVWGKQRALVICLLGCLISLLCSGCATLTQCLSRTRYWEKFPAPPGRSQGVSSIGEDRRGGIWIMSGYGMYYWSAADRTWIAAPLRSGQYLTQLHGDSNTGLYATQPGKEEHWGEVFALEGGRAEYVTRFYFDTATGTAGFCVIGMNRFLNWGGGKLRIYDTGKWIEHPADLPQTGTLVLRGENTVALYAGGLLHAVDRHNHMVTREVDASINRKAGKGALWGESKALVLEYGGQGVTGFDISTGRRVDTEGINRSLGSRSVYDVFSTPNGDAWILAHDRELASYVLFRVRPDGLTALIPDTAGIPWDNQQFTHSPRSVVLDKHGRLWFASDKIGVFCLADGCISQFDHRNDGSPAACGVLLQDGRGVIYAGSGTGFYAYNDGTSLTGAMPPAPIPRVALPTPVWRYELPSSDRLRTAWCLDEMILFVSHQGQALKALCLQSGEERFSIPLSDDDIGQAWITSGGAKGELSACLKDRVCAVDAATGVILRTLKSKRDHRIAPLAAGDDYILVREYRGNRVSRMTVSGREVWARQLPGYVMTHPAAFGPLFLLQTREGSYGGQTSCGIDCNTGEQLWSDIVDAYGAGAAFADDAKYCVESYRYLAPDTTEAWLIAREPRTGARRWHFRRPGTTIGHAPQIDTVNDRVFGVLDNGTVICVDGMTGRPVWETALPQPPASAPPASYDPYASCMSLSAEGLAIVTEDQMLYLIDPGTGRVLQRIVLVEDIISHGKRVGAQRLVSWAWIAGKLLVVATETGITAYNVANQQMHRTAYRRP